MSDHSLMNPDFLKEQLEGSIENYAKAETFNLEFTDDYNQIYHVIQNLELEDPRRETYPLTKDQAMHIIRTLANVKVNEYVFLSPRRVMISQYKQLLQDRRYRIATKLLHRFKK